MEAAPLTLAHTHARNAALETKRQNPVAASEEHDLAAAEFAVAAQSTKDGEALRILNLLEQHHKRLGQILKSKHTPIVEDTTISTMADRETIKISPSQPQTDPTRPSSPDNASQPPRLVRSGRPTARDLSSSIASNLASARGIPSTRHKRPTPVSPLVSNQHADGQFSQEEDGKTEQGMKKAGQPGSGSVSQSNRPSWAPPVDVSEAALGRSPVTKADSSSTDAPFQQFYSTFESLMSKLSAPLAFAGLPLTGATTTPSPTVTSPITSRSQAAKQVPTPTKPMDASLDYSQLISRAALRAVARNDKSAPYGHAAESFYVVPTTGGTTSYAEIMTRADREASHHRRNMSNLSNDSFEDAASTLMPPPPLPSTTPTKQPSRPGLSNEKKFNGKTMEELSLENKALKHLSDTLSKRLHVFEMSAQTSSAALAQSIRSLHLSPFTTPENSRGKATSTTAALNVESQRTTTTAGGIPPASSSSSANALNIEAVKLKTRVAELEEILRKSDAKARKREDENAKLRDTLVKYKDKWDSLKAGAKARRERVVAGESTGAGRGEGGGGSGREQREKDGEGI